MPNWKVLLLICALMLLSACNLSRTPPTTEPLPTESGDASSAGKPVVTISSPKSGDEIVVGTDVFVSANATDSVGITRVQLIANNQIVKTVSSESVAGDQNMNVLLDFRPAEQGNLVLEVIAYRGAVASDPALVNVVVRQSQAQVTATIVPQTNVPIIDPNDPTCRALTNVALNVRTGPSTVYPRITTLPAGRQVPIIGRVGDNSWWLVRISATTSGWVIQRNPLNPNEEFISIFGICTAIPIVNPPPSPTTTPATPTPTPTRTATPIPPITNTPTPADLLVISIVGPTALELPVAGSVTGSYSVTITNNGQANTGPFTNTIQLLPSGPVEELGVVSNLSAGESIALSYDLTYTAVGVYTIQVKADSDNNVVELSDVNNTGTIGVGVVPEP
ncbi:MAG: SH3 domain-containing protein [Anaerolineae bacterium]|nr:SH3 domain-containing protein [Anaerolineae bacterium]